MTTEGVDFSAARPGGAALVAAGKKFVLRYVPYSSLAKGLTKAEVADYRAHGIDIGLVFEQLSGRAMQGYAAGVEDATTSRDAAAYLGFPADQVIYFAVDWNATSSEQAAIDNYLKGAASVIGIDRVGVYAGYPVIVRCQASKTARWFWQTYAWSAGKIASGIHLYQYLNGQTLNGGSVDYDRAMQPQFGQWEADLAASAPNPDPIHYTVNVKGGGTAYYDLASTQAAFTVAAAGLAGVVTYGTDARGDGKVMRVIAVQLVKGGPLTQVWVGDDLCSGLVAVGVPPAPLTQDDVNAAYLGGEKAGYDYAVNGVKVGSIQPPITFPPRPA